jgi:FtsH-binding integral membrane protein
MAELHTAETTEPFANEQNSDAFIKDRYEVVAKQEYSIQRMFILKVYCLILFMLLLTAILIAINVFIPKLREFNVQNFYLAFVFLALTLILLIAVYLFAEFKVINFILLTMFTCAMGWMLGIFCSRYNAYEVLLGAGITTFMVILLSVYVLFTKTDFNWMGAGLSIALLGFVLASFFTLFLSFVFKVGRAWLFGLSGAGAILMSLFILYDTSRLLYHYAPDEVIFCAINLYLDFVNLFQYVLLMIKWMR